MAATTVNLSFQEELLRRIDEVARRESRSRSELIREATRQYIERKNRWADAFAMGEAAAVASGARPEDVPGEIAAVRRARRGEG